MDHGGDLISYESCFQGELIDFSSNINPLGPPKGLKEILINNFKALEAYPDIQYRKLKRSISIYLKCNKENILVGNGAVEIINNFTILANRVLIITPSFSEYEKRAIVHGRPVIRMNYRENFTIDIKALENMVEKDDLLILGNPNNPTGLRIEEKSLMEIYKVIKRKEAYLLLDEAFYEFSPRDYDSIELFKKSNYKNVGIIRAATKFFALPGIRLGYGCFSVEKAAELEKVELPWSINSLADAAGQFIFEDKDYIEKSKDYIEKERKYLMEELSKIEGLNPYKTHTNYILIKLLSWNEEYIFNFLLKKGIVIRKCSSFTNLSSGYIRVAIKDRDNNLRLINGLKELNRKGKD